MSNNLLGPLQSLVGIWEGVKGDDIAPDDDRGVENNKFRERLIFEDTGLVANHEQKLYGLRYKTTAWRIGAADPFHEELGFWMWDSDKQEVMRCFVIPRGITVLAGGKVGPDDSSFKLTSRVGSETYGISASSFLNEEFKTLRYDLEVTKHGENSFSYFEDTQLRIKGQNSIFHHTDKNTLFRVRE